MFRICSHTIANRKQSAIIRRWALSVSHQHGFIRCK
jgi:hypothetical protein